MIKRILLFLFSITTLLLLSHQANAAVPIQPAIGGAWYKATEEGHGFVINISEDNSGQLTFLATWYVYDTEGKQMWLLGSTPFSEGDMSVTVPVIVTQGAMFNNFNSNDVVRTEWGTLTFEFSSCGEGVVNYNPVLNFPAGAVTIERLTNTAGINCGNSNGDNQGSPTPVSGDSPSDNPGGFENGIEVISTRFEAGDLFGTGEICNVFSEVKNHSNKDQNIVVLIEAFSNSGELGTAALNGNVGAGQTTTLSNFILGKAGLPLCSQVKETKIKEVIFIGGG
ncbi:MAG: hypothetical protein V3V22_09700 [Methylococcales bacterium]